jgi:hypothetical protein
MLTAVSDPLAVAQKILVCHDTSELVFCALSSHIGAKPLDAKGNPIRLIKDATFMVLAIAVIEKIYGEEDDRVSLATELLDEMNRYRVAFKHFGTLPNVASSWHIFADVTSLLDDLCDRSIGSPLLDVDQTAAIQVENVKEDFRRARAFAESGQYREALEVISLTLHDSFWSANLPNLVTPGKALTEDALLLSGRGIDPASFLTMQKIIPTTHDGETVEWILRETGHSENWTAENVEFCLKTAISCVVKLQSAQAIPVPRDFYHWFDDVIEIAVDAPDILLDRHSLGLSISWEEQMYSKGVIGSQEG